MRPRGAGQRVDGAEDYVERRCDLKESVQSLERKRRSLSLFDDVLMYGVTAGLTYVSPALSYIRSLVIQFNTCIQIRTYKYVRPSC